MFTLRQILDKSKSTHAIFLSEEVTFRKQYLAWLANRNIFCKMTLNNSNCVVVWKKRMLIAYVDDVNIIRINSHAVTAAISALVKELLRQLSSSKD